MSANADYVRGFAAAWNQGDLELYLDRVGPDFEWVVAREHPAAKTHRGRDEVAAYIADWFQTMPDMRVEVEELEESGERVLAAMTMTGTGAESGAVTEVHVATITTFRDRAPQRTEEFLDLDEARRALAEG